MLKKMAAPNLGETNETLIFPEVRCPPTEHRVSMTLQKVRHRSLEASMDHSGKAKAKEGINKE